MLPTLYTEFGLDLWGVRIRAKFVNAIGGQKIKFLMFLNFRARNLRQDKRIPNLVSKLKSGNIWPRFWPKSCRKLWKTGKIAKFIRCRPFLGQKRGQMLSDFTFETRFGVLSSWRVWPQFFLNENFYFLTPYGTSKTSTILRGSLNLTDRAQISYTVFW